MGRLGKKRQVERSAFTQKALNNWLDEVAKVDEVDYRQHIRKAVVYALNTELSDIQRKYYIMYHIDGMSINKIADEFGVNKSTVSRTLKRANVRMGDVLKFSAPHLLNKSVVNRNRRAKRKYYETSYGGKNG